MRRFLSHSNLYKSVQKSVFGSTKHILPQNSSILSSSIILQHKSHFTTNIRSLNENTNHLDNHTEIDSTLLESIVSINILEQRTKLHEQYLDHMKANDGKDDSKNNDGDGDGDDNKNDGNDNSKDDDNHDDDDEDHDEGNKLTDAYNMTPTEIISELDRFVIGQNDAKKAVAVSWRARWRRRQLNEDYKREVTPKNILMIGPTGCGKTEVARRLARLSYSPFVKVEATKFTEVGYVGKDVSSIIEDLVASAAILVKKRKKYELRRELKKQVNELILYSLMGKLQNDSELKYWNKKLKDGTLDDMNVEIEVAKDNDISSFLRGGLRTNPYLIFASGDGPGGGMQQKMEKKQYPIKRAREILIEQELKKYLSDSDLANQAVELAENDGIVFLDEVDKICGSKNAFGGSERKVSQEGVQRDLLPLIEGTSVSVQNYGKVNTDHILFICAGAFHDSKPSDLMPEFQGRLPVRVELKPLTKEDMVAILSVTEYNLINQQIEMLKTENCQLHFTEDAIDQIAETAVICNDNVENIGARRLVTVLEKIMGDINVEASEIKKEGKSKEYAIDKAYVLENVGEIGKGEDFEKFIL